MSVTISGQNGVTEFTETVVTGEDTGEDTRGCGKIAELYNPKFEKISRRRAVLFREAK